MLDYLQDYWLNARMNIRVSQQAVYLLAQQLLRWCCCVSSVLAPAGANGVNPQEQDLYQHSSTLKALNLMTLSNLMRTPLHGILT
jgi:hypothetical protein